MSPIKDAPVKVVHMWLSVFVIVAAGLAGAGGVIWQIATANNQLGSIAKSVDSLSVKVEAVAAKAQSNTETNIRQDGELETVRQRIGIPSPTFGGVSVR